MRYCTLPCQTNIYSRPIICENTHNGRSSYYNVSASPTSKSLNNGEWERQLMNTRVLSGHYVSDVLEIEAKNASILSANSFEFVDAFAMDTRLIF